MQFDLYSSFPDELQKIEPQEIRKVFPNPSVIHIEGRQPEPVFVSVLLHGNEISGFYILKKLAEKVARQPHLPRSLAVFIGNVWACEAGQRQLNHQHDFNRIWQGGGSSEHRLAKNVTAWAQQQNIFASIDIHNNTGVNPFYACVNKTTKPYLYLARLFSHIVVFFDNPRTVQSRAFAEFCPAVTVECGQAGNPEGINKGLQLVWDTLHLSGFAIHADIRTDIEMYHTVGRVLIDVGSCFSFENGQADIIFPSDFEKLNFSLLPAGYVLGRLSNNKLPLKVIDENGCDLTANFLMVDDNRLVLKRQAVPSMFTTDEIIIRGDCLGYFMEPYHVEGGGESS